MPSEHDLVALYRRDPFLEAYIATMLQDLQLSEAEEATSEQREARDAGTIYTLPHVTFDRCRQDCDAFKEAARGLLADAIGTAYSWEQAGSDLWLTRCGHGVGFWDRGLGAAGDQLTALVGHGTGFPSLDAYIGDDGRVYLA